MRSEKLGVRSEELTCSAKGSVSAGHLIHRKRSPFLSRGRLKRPIFEASLRLSDVIYLLLTFPIEIHAD